jgi:hypothetical protein
MVSLKATRLRVPIVTYTSWFRTFVLLLVFPLVIENYEIGVLFEKADKLVQSSKKEHE